MKDIKLKDLNFKDINLKDIKLKKFLKKIRRGGFTWMDKLSFPHIFLIWISVVILFGVIYHFSQSDRSYLFYVVKAAPVDAIKDTIYFSFISATTTGFGDIIPFGIFKFIAIFEVVFGLMLLAIVTSKLISIKQDVILGELYEFSLTERANRMRASLLLFRQNIDRLISSIEEKTIQKREVNRVYIYFSSLEDSLNETLALLERPENTDFIKTIDAVNEELIFNSTLNSFDKLNELLTTMNQNKLEWKTELTLDLINQCLNLLEVVFQKISSSENLRKGTVLDFNTRKTKIVSAIKSSMEQKAEKKEGK